MPDNKRIASNGRCAMVLVPLLRGKRIPIPALLIEHYPELRESADPSSATSKA